MPPATVPPATPIPSSANSPVEPREPLSVVVLASGAGTLLQALLDVAAEPAAAVRVVAVGTDRAGIESLARADRAGVPSFVTAVADHADRDSWDAALTAAVAAHEPDVVVSAGFMKLLGGRFLGRFPNRVINTHPALLPSFPGMHAVRDALAAGVKVTGSTVHFVDAGMDTGPVIAQEAVQIADDDDEATLHERIKSVERRLLVDVVARLARQDCIVEGRKVMFR